MKGGGNLIIGAAFYIDGEGGGGGGGGAAAPPPQLNGRSATVVDRIGNREYMSPNPENRLHALVTGWLTLTAGSIGTVQRTSLTKYFANSAPL